MRVSQGRSLLGFLLVALSAGVAAPPIADGAPAVPPTKASRDVQSAAAPPVKTPGCTARLRDTAHLRPQPQEVAAGPLIAAGTVLEVLRSVPSVKRKLLFLYQVRVPASGATGYLFLRDSELDISCPLVWPSPEDKTPSAPLSAPSDESDCYKRGPVKSRRQLISSACWDEDAAKSLAVPLEQLDGDFMGQIMTVSQDADSQFGLLFHNKQGWRAYLVEVQSSERHNISWQTVIHAGRAAYLLLTDVSDYEEAAGDTETYVLFRLLSDGRLFEVLRLPLYPAGSRQTLACKARGNADESVTFRCRSGRSQSFTWDAAVNRLIPKLL